MRFASSAFQATTKFAWFAGVVALGCATSTQDLPYHVSDDFQTQVLYLTKVVAMAKHLSVYPDGDSRTSFTLGRAHQEDAELASDTGDRFDQSVRGLIKRVGTSTDGRWLLAESEEYDWENRTLVTYATAIELSSAQFHSARDGAALGKLVPGGVASTKLEPVELFFDRCMISRFHLSFR